MINKSTLEKKINSCKVVVIVIYWDLSVPAFDIYFSSPQSSPVEGIVVILILQNRKVKNGRG